MDNNVRTGIAVAGTVIVDKIKEISAYPEAGQLTQIRSIQNAIGGCVPNVALDLKKIAPELTVSAIGTIGDDMEGAIVKDVLSAGGLDVSGLIVKAGERTSFTDVMSIPGGQRTFFTYPGASAGFGVEDVDFAAVCYKRIAKMGGRELFASPETKKKAVAALLRYGFSYEDIKEALKIK